MPSNGKRTASRRLNAVKLTLRGQAVHFVVVVAVNVVDLHPGLGCVLVSLFGVQFADALERFRWDFVGGTGFACDVTFYGIF